MAGEIHFRGLPKLRGLEPELRRRRLLAARRYKLRSIPRVAILLGQWDKGSIVASAGAALEALGSSRYRKAWSNRRDKRRRLLKRLMERHESRCAHCGKVCVPHTSHVQQPDGATIDHVKPRCEIPVAKWFDVENCVLSCFACNQARGAEAEAERRRAAADA